MWLAAEIRDSDRPQKLTGEWDFFPTTRAAWVAGKLMYTYKCGTKMKMVKTVTRIRILGVT